MFLGQAKRVRNSKIKRHLEFAVLAVVGLPAILFLLYWASFRASSHNPSPSNASLPSENPSSWLLVWRDAEITSDPDSVSSRPVYPYSVVPGGVLNAKELRDAIHRDPVIAAHYAGFGMQSVRPIRLARARQVYVSYRFGNRIYWTQKKLTLRAGEMLLTDGAHLARARCGNRISEVPARPVSPSEPPHEVFDEPVGLHRPEFTPDPLPIAPIWEENPSLILLALNSPAPSGPPGGGGPFLPLIPIFPCCGGSSPSRKPPASPLPQPGPLPPPSPGPLPQPFPPAPPPVATPELPSLVLLIAGFAGLFCLWKIRRP